MFKLTKSCSASCSIDYVILLFTKWGFLLYGKSITSRRPIRLLDLNELCTNDSLKLFGAHLMAQFINLLKMKTSVIRKSLVEPKSPDNGGSTVIS